MPKDIWKTKGKPEGEAVLTTRDHDIKLGYWDSMYWWYDDKYHREDEVIMWAPLETVLEETKWLECLENYRLTR